MIRGTVYFITALSLAAALSWTVEKICMDLADWIREVGGRVVRGMKRTDENASMEDWSGSRYYVDEKGNRFDSANDMYEYHRAVTVSQLDINRFY